VDEVIAAYRAEGLDVAIDLRLDTAARLQVTDPGEPDRQHRVELVANWVPGRRCRWTSVRCRSPTTFSREDGRGVQPGRRPRFRHCVEMP
jgi:hypothetical protein